MTAEEWKEILRRFEARLDEKFDDFFRGGEIQQALAASGIISDGQRLVMREFLMLAYVAGAEALSEMLRDDELESRPKH